MTEEERLAIASRMRPYHAIERDMVERMTANKGVAKRKPWWKRIIARLKDGRKEEDQT